MHLGAIVVVPPGFDDSPDRRYPVLYKHDHFKVEQPFFLEAPPDASLKGTAWTLAEAKFRFFRDWSEGRLPEAVIVLIQDPNPFFDSSYGVNSANLGPYGDALIREFYPYIEKKFRGIGEPWSRVVYGGSTGGWASLAQQLFYPDYFGGSWAFCPDSLDFRAFQTIDIYRDTNAFYDIGPFSRIPKPLARLLSGRLMFTVEDISRQQFAIGAKNRSGGQMDAFEAVYGPVGPDGYPARLWDPETGVIDAAVARYWRDNYDLSFILKRTWRHIGPKLVGKLHIIVGDADTYYLENAVRLIEEVLESTKRPENGPYYSGSIVYGSNAAHCYTGVPPGTTMEQHYLRVFFDHMQKMAPK
jgi:hypothetical protein